MLAMNNLAAAILACVLLESDQKHLLGVVL